MANAPFTFAKGRATFYSLVRTRLSIPCRFRADCRISRAMQDVPITHLSGEKFNQPIFGANYLSGYVAPVRSAIAVFVIADDDVVWAVFAAAARCRPHWSM